MRVRHWPPAFIFSAHFFCSVENLRNELQRIACAAIHNLPLTGNARVPDLRFRLHIQTIGISIDVIWCKLRHITLHWDLYIMERHIIAMLTCQIFKIRRYFGQKSRNHAILLLHESVDSLHCNAWTLFAFYSNIELNPCKSHDSWIHLSYSAFSYLYFYAKEFFSCFMKNPRKNFLYPPA